MTECNSCIAQFQWGNETISNLFGIKEEITWVAKMRSSPIAKKARKAYMLLKQKAPKQNPAPINVVTERSWKKVQGIEWQRQNVLAWWLYIETRNIWIVLRPFLEVFLIPESVLYSKWHSIISSQTSMDQTWNIITKEEKRSDINLISRQAN